VRQVTLLTTGHCRLCDDAKDVLHRLAGELAFEFECHDLDTERGRQLAEGTGMAFPPAVLVDGRPFSYGRLSERKLRRALAEGR